ncbi:hypothetical protein [Kitasatospora sp. NPDC058190]
MVRAGRTTTHPWADAHWATLSSEDRVAARSQLKHIDDPAEEQAAAA